jgi:hypothetical protein
VDDESQLVEEGLFKLKVGARPLPSKAILHQLVPECSEEKLCAENKDGMVLEDSSNNLSLLQLLSDGPCAFGRASKENNFKPLAGDIQADWKKEQRSGASRIFVFLDGGMIEGINSLLNRRRSFLFP